MTLVAILIVGVMFFVCGVFASALLYVKLSEATR